MLRYFQDNVTNPQDMADAASCSSSSSEKYDVFLSFRGEDTHRNFVSHLYTALLQKQIKTYKDDKTLEKGDEVWPALVCAIKDSYLYIVVFSKDYASSTWCLRELTQILECKKEGEIILVFYEIDPSHVRKQTGSYKEAFEKHEKDSNLEEETVRKWRASLEKAANFSGWDSQSKAYR